jgi:hypothetical protein
MAKKITQAQRIRDYFTKNPSKTVSEVAKAMGVPYQIAYMTKRDADKKKKAEPKQEWKTVHISTSDNSIEAAMEKELPVTMEPSALDVQIAGSHYKDKPIQPVEYISANNLNFLEGCVVKRITRWREKPVEKRFDDLHKIKHEIDLLIEMESKYPKKS